MLRGQNKAIVTITVLWDAAPYTSVDTETAAPAASALNMKAACSPDQPDCTASHPKYEDSVFADQPDCTASHPKYRNLIIHRHKSVKSQ
jgi:hypothetical protein